MARHQIIYTSCMRGRDGVNDGQQIFSYDETFSERTSDDVKGLFTYQVPTLPSGTIMTEEIAATMPASFMYRRLSNGCSAISLNTYLGRDYMGSSGRFGNYLSHSIVCDFEDFDIYPCEMYAGPALRSSMEYEEVNNPNLPDYLPVPELSPGYIIDPDSIVDFLGIGENIDYFKKMAAAMLNFQKDQKRIVICDETENIVKWIAALHYVLPLDLAKTVNFSTYEKDPELSVFQICGVIPEGSRYNVTNYINSNNYYVFDFINDQFSEIEVSNSLIDFLDTAFSFSYDSLTDFHEFVISRTKYRECGKGYYQAYYLYNILNDGLSGVSKEEFSEIVDFSSEYLYDDTLHELIEKITGEEDSLDQLDSEYELIVLGFLLKYYNILDREQQGKEKMMLVDCLLKALSSEDVSESSFDPLYDNISQMASEAGLSIPAELMTDRNRTLLLGYLEQKTEPWKVLFIVKIISGYVLDKKLSIDELYQDRPIGNLYFGIIGLMYSNSKQNGRKTIERILQCFKEKPVYFVNMALNIEGSVKDLNLDESATIHLWECFLNYAQKMDEDSIDSINRILLDSERYDEMYQLYSRQISEIGDLKEARKFFEDYWKRWIEEYPDYCSAHAAEIVSDYYKILDRKKDSISEKEAFKYTTDMLQLALDKGIKDDFVGSLCQMVCEFIPLEKPNSDNLKLLRSMFKYYIETARQPIEGKLLLFYIAWQLGRVEMVSDLSSNAKTIKRYGAKNGAELRLMEEKEIKEYFEWAFDNLEKFSLNAQEYSDIYDLFDFDRQSHSLFIEYFCKLSFKECKDDSNYNPFGEFLEFMFKFRNRENEEMVGKYLCKLNKLKLEVLDTAMHSFFKGNLELRRSWDNVKEIASNTSFLKNSFSNLFKKNK